MKMPPVSRELPPPYTHRQDGSVGVIVNTEWESWFAWRPVKVAGKWRWLRQVQRRLVEYSDGVSEWEYYLTVLPGPCEHMTAHYMYYINESEELWRCKVCTHTWTHYRD